MAAATPPPTLSSLPGEVLQQILSYLALPHRLRFAQTSRRHYEAAVAGLTQLQLAVLPRKMHTTLAFLQTSSVDDVEFMADYEDDDSDHPARRHRIALTCPLRIPLTASGTTTAASAPDHPLGAPSVTPDQYRTQLIRLQNDRASVVLSTPTLTNLRSLTLHLYTVESAALTTVLATHFPRLRRLHLNFSHPYLHDTCLPPRYWTSPRYLTESAIWDPLAGMGTAPGPSALRLTSLTSLTVDRAAISSRQLQRLVTRNRDLAELRLRNVSGVDADFVRCLGRLHCHGPDRREGASPVPLAPCKVLELHACSSLSLGAVHDFGWLDSLLAGHEDRSGSEHASPATPPEGPTGPGLQVFSVKDSTSVSQAALLKYFDATRPPIHEVTLPDGRVLIPRTRARVLSHCCSECAVHATLLALRPRVVGQQCATTGSAATMSVDTAPAGVDPAMDDDELDDSSRSHLCPVPPPRCCKMHAPQPGREHIIEPDSRWSR